MPEFGRGGVVIRVALPQPLTSVGGGCPAPVTLARSIVEAEGCRSSPAAPARLQTRARARWPLSVNAAGLPEQLRVPAKHDEHDKPDQGGSDCVASRAPEKPQVEGGEIS